MFGIWNSEKTEQERLFTVWSEGDADLKKKLC
jgi:hypothetical protein